MRQKAEESIGERGRKRNGLKGAGTGQVNGNGIKEDGKASAEDEVKR